MRKYGTTWTVFVLLLVLITFVFSLTNFSRRDEQVKFSTLVDQIQDATANPAQSNFEQISITNGDNIVHLKLKGDSREKPVVVPIESKNELIKNCLQAKIPIRVRDVDKSSMWFGMLSSFFLPILVIVGLLFMFRAAQAGGTMARTLEWERIQGLEMRIAQLEEEVDALQPKSDSNEPS